MRRLLIDANVYLDFYRFSKDDLEELRKLAELVRQGEIVLYVNQQLTDEFRRNRERVLADALKMVGEAKIPATFPQVLRNYDRFKKLSEARTAFAAEIDLLLTRAREDAAKGALPADSLINELWPLATELPITEAIMVSAKARFDRGNPPGKDRSYGDAITWETLLAHHPWTEPLDIVTADKDYVSPLNASSLSGFLAREWADRKFSPVCVYDTLSSYLRKHYPDIKLSTEVASELAIARLEDSGSFQSTHRAIAQLQAISDFSTDQVRRLLDAATNNDQVRLIILDVDVQEFFMWLLDTFEDVIDDVARVDELRELLEDERVHGS